MLLTMFVIVIDTKKLKKNMQRDKFKGKIIKWSNYSQNEYYIIKLCFKNLYNINKMWYISSDPWIPHSYYINLLIFN